MKKYNVSIFAIQKYNNIIFKKITKYSQEIDFSLVELYTAYHEAIIIDIIIYVIFNLELHIHGCIDYMEM